MTAAVSPAVSPAISPAEIGLISPTTGVNPTVSANGQFVVYSAPPATADGRTSSVWLTDRETGDVIELTQMPTFVARAGDSVNPVISADGCSALVTTQIGYDIYYDEDLGSRWDVYRTRLPACGGTPNNWNLMSSYHDADGAAHARNDVDITQPAATSARGTVVSYARPFESLSGNDDPTRKPTAVDVVDLALTIDDADYITAAPGLPRELASNSVQYVGQRAPVLSADGSILVFVSDATSNEAVPDWTPPLGEPTVPTQVYAWNRADLDPFTAVTIMSAGANGAGNASSGHPAVSADGRVVTFESIASNLVGGSALRRCGKVCPAQIYAVVHETDNSLQFDLTGPKSITLVSRVGGPGQSESIIGNAASFAPSMTDDGNTIVFTSQATNLMEVRAPGGGQPGDGDILMADLGTGQLRRVFDSPIPAPAAHAHARIAGKGRAVVADSLVADRLVAGVDANDAVMQRKVVVASFVPQLSIAHLDLGTVLVSVPGPEWKVNVINLGPGAFTPSSAHITIDNPAFALTGGSCFDDASVNPGQACAVEMLLLPSIAGPVAGTLTVAEEPGYDAITITSPVTGAGGEPALDTFPKASDFQQVIVGETSATPATFSVYNIYPLPTIVTGATLSGANPQDFAISRNACGTELPVAENCKVEISFTPTVPGRRTATLSFNTALGQYTSVLISGEGFYDPTVLVADSVRPGRNLGVGGIGFPADTQVLISFADGSGRIATATTDQHGQFVVNLFVPKSQRSGDKTVIVRAADGSSAGAPVTIQRPRNKGASSAGWAGGAGD